MGFMGLALEDHVQFQVYGHKIFKILCLEIITACMTKRDFSQWYHHKNSSTDVRMVH